MNNSSQLNIPLARLGTNSSWSVHQTMKDMLGGLGNIAKKIYDFVVPIFRAILTGLVLGFLAYVNPTFFVVGCLMGVAAEEKITRTIENISNIWKTSSFIARGSSVVGAFFFAAETFLISSVLFPASIVAQRSVDARNEIRDRSLVTV